MRAKAITDDVLSRRKGEQKHKVFTVDKSD